MTEGTTTRKFNYIEGGDGLAAVAYSTNGGSHTIRYVLTDHQGSICKIVNTSGAAYYSATYDAWGKPTVLKNGMSFHRGYTGHEHLSEFNLINMNGRMYDPLLSRFLSPDPFVQMPDFSKNFNRYSYCLNNPMKYTDPDWEKWWHWLLPGLVAPVSFGTSVSIAGMSAAKTALMFMTDEGYAFQKLIAPTALQIDYRNGNHQSAFGFDTSIGFPQITPVTYRVHGGISYYNSSTDLIGNDMSGWETRY